MKKYLLGNMPDISGLTYILKRKGSTQSSVTFTFLATQSKKETFTSQQTTTLRHNTHRTSLVLWGTNLGMCCRLQSPNRWTTAKPVIWKMTREPWYTRNDCFHEDLNLPTFKKVTTKLAISYKNNLALQLLEEPPIVRLKKKFPTDTVNYD
jgi:hypothetical protein